MIRVEYYKKNKKVYHYYPTQAELEEIDKRKRNIMYARRYAEKKALEEYVEQHKCGYCPKCFMLKPMTGICPTCD